MKTNRSKFPLALFDPSHMGNLTTPDKTSHNITKLVGGFNPIENYARQIGSSPQVGVKL